MNWLFNNLPLVLELTLEHVKVSVPPIAIGFIVSIPMGWLAHRYKLTRGLLLTVIGIIYTVPSIALLVLLPPLIGVPVLSAANVIIALSIYAVAIMVRSMADALDSVDDDIKRSATAIGYSSWGRFWRVEFPLAGPVLIAGLRVVAVSTVSLATVGILVGVQSLGYLFTNGLQRNIPVEIATGIVMTVVVALVLDALIVLIGRVLLPWAKVGTPSRRVQRMRLLGERP